MVNSENNRWIALSTQGAQTLIRYKHRVDIMVFGIVTNDDEVMLQSIFLHSLRLNMKAYIVAEEASAVLDS